MPTIGDVARRAGVSVSTVSKVLNERPNVRAEVRARVRAVVAELGYRPSQIARALHTKRTRTLAYLVPTIENPFFGSVLRTVEDVAHQEGYGVFVGSTHGDPARVAVYRDRLLAIGVDGVLATQSWDIVGGDLVSTLLDRGVPVVGVGGTRTTAAIDCYVPADVAGGAMAAGYLLGLGHRGIAFIGARDSRTTELRYQGVRQALAEAGSAHDADLLVRVGGFGEGDGAAAIHELLLRRVPFTAVVAFNDVVALGAQNALEDQGLRVPGRVSLVGFDDTVAAYSRPKMTTVACSKADLGEQAVRRLLARIAGDPAGPEVHPLPMHLVARASTAAAGRG